MVLTGDNTNELIGGIITITNNIALETMKHSKGGLYEPYRT